MTFQKGKAEDFEKIKSFYWNVIDAMKDKDFSIGWKKGIYPDDDYIRESLEKGELYTLKDEEKLCACVIVNCSFNEEYEGLPWRKTLKKGEFFVPHALAVAGDMQGKGIGKEVVGQIIGLAHANNKKAVRLDIVSTNKIAEKLYKSFGFEFVSENDIYYVDTGHVKYKMYELNF